MGQQQHMDAEELELIKRLVSAFERMADAFERQAKASEESMARLNSSLDAQAELAQTLKDEVRGNIF